eukprot:5439166-Pyramimonas_sp.AAC.1
MKDQSPEWTMLFQAVRSSLRRLMCRPKQTHTSYLHRLHWSASCTQGGGSEGVGCLARPYPR